MKTAFIIPAYNEEGAIGKTIANANMTIPNSEVFVCDNNSTDLTKDEAIRSGAKVITEPKKGKGNAMRKLFKYVDADIYIMVDGDNTYNLQCLTSAIEYFIQNDLDLMTGNRFAMKSKSYMRKGHQFGNKIFTKLLNYLCNVETSDIFSGLRIMSRRFVDSFPIVSSEFEIETEISVFASKMKFASKDFPTEVKSRQNTLSKLNTYKDGFKIIYFIIHLLHREFPMKLYLPLSLIQSSCSIIFLVGIYAEFLSTGLVERFPTLIVSSLLLLSSLITFSVGLILKGLVNIKYENRYLAYMSSKRKFNRSS